MIDIHCHILPAMDDGPMTLETSLVMAKISAADGITTIIATPHTDGLNVNRDSVIKAVSTLNRELQINNIQLTILPGYEIPYELSSDLAASHTLAGSKYVLMEFPHDYLPHGATNTIYNLISSGLKPIIAHPERNSAVLVQPSLLSDIAYSGALIQITASSLTGELGPDIQQCALYLINNDLVDFVATDSHSPTFRAPVLKKAYNKVKKLKGKRIADLVLQDNPARILQDTA